MISSTLIRLGANGNEKNMQLYAYQKLQIGFFVFYTFLYMPSEKLFDLWKCKLRLLNHRNVHIILINVFTMSPVLFLTILIN